MLLVIVAVLAIFDWNWAKGPIQRVVSGNTERDFRIGGDLDVDFFPLEVHAEKVSLSNASWSDQKTMARAEKVDLQVRFWPLFVGRVTMPNASLDQPYLRLERNEKGVGNWQFGSKPASRRARCDEESCSRLRIQQLRISNGVFELREPTLKTSVDLAVESAKPTREDALAPLKLSGKGTYRNAPFELRGQVDSPLALQGKAEPYRVDLRARAGDTRGHVFGSLAEPLQIQQVTVNLEMSGPDLAHLYRFTGVVLPHSPPYELKGRLTRLGDKFSYRKFSGTVGDSDLSGDATVDIGGDRPKLTATLHSKVLDFDDLAGFVGGTPGAGEGETISDEQKEEASARRASGKFLPSASIELEKLRAMDADVRLNAARVESGRLPLEDMTAHLVLTNGKLTLDPLDFGAAGGNLASVVEVDAREDPARFGMAMRIEHLELPKLLPRAKVMQDAIGTIYGSIVLEGSGDSTASMLASSKGSLAAIMGQGQISNLVLEVAGLDIAESLAFLIGDDQQVTLRCAYADFEVVDGIATARSVAMDTSDTALLLRGDFSFKDESLDLRLLPKPKDMSPVAIRTPILIGGTFADPSLGPEPGPLLLRGAAVAALAAVAPPLALLGLIETGPGKDLNCGGEPVKQKKPKDKQAKSKDKPAQNPGPRPAT